MRSSPRSAGCGRGWRLSPDYPRPVPATLDLALAQLADELEAVTSELRGLLARAALFDEAGYAQWQLLTMLNSLGLHGATVAQLRRIIGRRAVDDRATKGGRQGVRSSVISIGKRTPENTGWQARAFSTAALADAAPLAAGRLLEALADVHLLEEHLPGRYRFHDLIRQLASQLARTEEPDPRGNDAARRRLLDYWLHVANLAGDEVEPGRRRVDPRLTPHPRARPGARQPRAGDGLAGSRAPQPPRRGRPCRRLRPARARVAAPPCHDPSLRASLRSRRLDRDP